MARQLDQRTLDVLKNFHPDPNSALWDCHGTWVIYHKDVELIAAKAKVSFDMPVILESNGQTKCVAICVMARLPDGASTWSIGEAAPGNNKNAYPYAMAEKRARDRVVLKLLGLHGVYSEYESDDFKEDNRATPRQSQDTASMAYVARAKSDMQSYRLPDALAAWWRDEAKERERQGVVKGTPLYDDLHAAFAALGKKLSEHRNAA